MQVETEEGNYLSRDTWDKHKIILLHCHIFCPLFIPPYFKVESLLVYCALAFCVEAKRNGMWGQSCVSQLCWEEKYNMSYPTVCLYGANYSWPGKSKLDIFTVCNSMQLLTKTPKGNSWKVLDIQKKTNERFWCIMSTARSNSSTRSTRWMKHHVTVTLAFHNRGDNYRKPNPSLQPDIQSQRWTMTVIHSNKVRHVGAASLCNYGGSFAQHYLLKVQYKKSPKLASEQIFIKKDIVDNEHVEFST